MDKRKVKRIYHPPAVSAADLFKGGKARRVAAYARVSTASDKQLNSVAAQKDYFAKLIRQRPVWIFVGVYVDEGITGTSINRREAFNRMVTDALAGNVDLIVTKSIFRFARNTVDTLNTIRQLKAANVEVFFEKENIYTMDSKGEFLITLLSSIAEEESMLISENVKWGQRKRLADGKYSVQLIRYHSRNRFPDCHKCPQLHHDPEMHCALHSKFRGASRKHGKQPNSRNRVPGLCS